MSFLITILLLVNLGFIFFSVWAWLKKSDAISEIVAMTVFSGLVTLVAWGVTTDDENNIIPFLADILEKPISFFLLFSSIFFCYLSYLNLKRFYQKIKNNTYYWSDIFYFFLNGITLLFLIIQSIYYSTH